MAYTEVAKKEMEWKVPFKRDDAFPLDRSTIFTSKGEAEEYISATKEKPHKKGVPYVGQTIAVSFINEETNEEYLDIYKIIKTGEEASMSPIIDLSDSLYYDNNNKLGIKIVDTNTSYNALTTDNTGALTVPMMDVKATKITEDIVIKDGPLASIAEQAYPNGKVPADTSIEDFLKSLLCVEIWPNATANTSDYKLILTGVSVTHSLGTSTIGLVDDNIKFNTVNAKEVTIEKTNPTVKPFTYGYSNEIKGDIISTTSITEAWSISAVTGGCYSLSASTTNFSGEVPSMVTATTYNKCSLPECNLKIALGKNKYTITEKAPNHVGSHSEIGSKYIVSNLGNRSESKKSEAITGKTSHVRECNPKETSSTIYGVYPIFTNVSNSGNTLNPNTIVKATTTSQTIFTIEYFDTEGVNKPKFAYPSDRNITSVQLHNKQFDTWSDVSDKNQSIVDYNDISKNNKTYKLWEYTGNALEDPEFKFELSKKIGE